MLENKTARKGGFVIVIHTDCLYLPFAAFTITAESPYPGKTCAYAQVLPGYLFILNNMSVRPTAFVNDEFYHLYNRGNSKQVIFHDDQDHRYFMNLLDIMNTQDRLKTRFVKGDTVRDRETNIVSIGAYCLMPNHFHILVKQEKDNGVTLFMQKISTAYVMYYNKKYKRTGALFEGKFKSKYAGEDRYLKYLFSYIHLNPLKILDQNWKVNPVRPDKQTFLSKYPYSSFNEYQTGEHSIINEIAFPEYFPNKTNFVNEVSSWLRLGE